MIRERHGVLGLSIVTTPAAKGNVTVGDGIGHVHLTTSHMKEALSLTPEEARWFAQQLIDSAARVEAANSKEK